MSRKNFSSFIEFITEENREAKLAGGSEIDIDAMIKAAIDEQIYSDRGFVGLEVATLKDVFKFSTTRANRLHHFFNSPGAPVAAPTTPSVVRIEDPSNMTDEKLLKEFNPDSDAGHDEVRLELDRRANRNRFVVYDAETGKYNRHLTAIYFAELKERVIRPVDYFEPTLSQFFRVLRATEVFQSPVAELDPFGQSLANGASVETGIKWGELSDAARYFANFLFAGDHYPRYEADQVRLFGILKNIKTPEDVKNSKISSVAVGKYLAAERDKSLPAIRREVGKTPVAQVAAVGHSSFAVPSEVKSLLYRMLPSQLVTIMSLLNMPSAHIPGSSASHAVQVDALVRWVESPGGVGLDKLKAEIDAIVYRNRF